MMVFPLYEQIDVSILTDNFNRFMVKDYVKSVKGTEFPKFFDNTITQGEFDKWMEIFYQYRGNLLTGGICIKEYLDLKNMATKLMSTECFINHKVAAVSKNSTQPSYANSILD